MQGDDLEILLFCLTLAVGFGLEAVKAETITRRSVFGILTAAAALTGAFWLQIKTVWPPFTAATTAIATNPTNWFVVLMFILAIFAFQWPRVSARSKPAKSVRNSALLETQVTDAPREFVTRTPMELTALYSGRTNIQGDALASIYLGKWLKAEGTVLEVDDTTIGRDAEPAAYAQFLYGRTPDGAPTFISAVFCGHQYDRAIHLTTNTIIEVVGKIKRINSTHVSLDPGELL